MCVYLYDQKFMLHGMSELIFNRKYMNRKFTNCHLVGYNLLFRCV